nr:Chain Z, Uncharacterized peptide [synthetic construct]
AEAAQA